MNNRVFYIVSIRKEFKIVLFNNLIDNINLLQFNKSNR